MIRSKIVELTSFEGIAYREKRENSFVITVQRLVDGETASVVLDKPTRGLLPVGDVDQSVFLPAVFEEALALITGLPYLERGLPQVSCGKQTKEAPWPVLASQEYKTLLRAYSDDTGRLDFTLLRKDLAEYASQMKDEGMSREELCLTALGVVFEKINGKTPERALVKGCADALNDACLTCIFSEIEG